MKKMERSFLASILILIASCSLSQTQPSTPPQGWSFMPANFLM